MISGRWKRRNRTSVACRSFTCVLVYICGYFGYVLLLLQPFSPNEECSKANCRTVARTMMEEVEEGRAVLLDTDVVVEDSRRVQPMRHAYAAMLQWEGLEDITALMKQYWEGKLLCSSPKIQSIASKKTLPILINVTFGCRDLYENARLGTGNYISLYYGIRVVARIFGDVDVSFACPDAEETKKSLVIPWLMGVFPGRPSTQHSEIPITRQQMCNHFFMAPLTYIHKEIQYDLRRMAIGLLGIPRNDHPSAQLAESSLWSQNSR